MARGVLDSSEIVLDIFCNVRSQVVPGISLERRAIWTNQEFLKIPGNVCPLDWLPDQQLRVSHQAIRVITGVGQLLLQECEDRVLVLTISFHLSQHCHQISQQHRTQPHLVKQFSFELKPIARPHMFQGCQDFLSTGVLLVAKLVSGKCQDCKLFRELLA